MGLWRHGSGELIDFAKWHTRCSCPSSSMPLFHALITRWQSQRRRRVRAERELIAVMGQPLLARDRLRRSLGAAARPFRVVLADTPAAARGPDLEMFAALAGGALLVVRKGEDASRLASLRRRLTRCAARPVAAVFNYT